MVTTTDLRATGVSKTSVNVLLCRPGPTSLQAVAQSGGVVELDNDDDVWSELLSLALSGKDDGDLRGLLRALRRSLD